MNVKEQNAFMVRTVSVFSLSRSARPAACSWAENGLPDSTAAAELLSIKIKFKHKFLLFFLQDKV